MISIDTETCSQFETATSREWLETNGIGGFASGTISGANTRRYHSILTAATRPPLGRIRTVAKFEETLIIDGVRYELSSNQYPGTIYPEGHKYISNFRLDPFPIWTILIDEVELEKRLFMPHGMNACVCRWQLIRPAAGRAVALEIRPLLALADYHQLRQTDARLSGQFEIGERSVSIQACDEMPRLFFCHNSAAVDATGHWYRNFIYSIERERGFDHSEDLFQPFCLSFDLSGAADLVVSIDGPITAAAAALEKQEIKRRTALVRRSGVKDESLTQLVLAADQFVVARGAGRTLIAGYPWFSDWGRDTMISLTGITLATGQKRAAKEIIAEFAKHVSQGMIPNRFPDEGEEAEYNTVDATLWYFEAVRSYVQCTGDRSFIKRSVYSTLADIIAWHLKGTRFNIHIDTDGLLYAGEPGVQLTWMDARVGDQVITPRVGKPVEIQALWFNALMTMADLAKAFGHERDAAKFLAMAELARLSFNALFWNDAEGCLFDVVDNGHCDSSIRPNQIFAVSLYHSMLESDRARAVVDKVETELLTPYGLRSLARNDPQYVPYYEGGPAERDSAYHQGTVWAWLIGPFVDAYRRVYPDRPQQIRDMTEPLLHHLSEAGLGQISEIFDAETPHQPRGCPAQAWSVAELLRVLTA